MRARDWQLPVILLFGAGLSAALYLGAVGWLGGELGFPLDDAWIHQTYARNLAEQGQWSYVSGRPSTGSTSPLWTLALTPAYRLGVDYRSWTYALGALALVWLSWLSWRLALRLVGRAGPVPWLAALFCAMEWHVVWAAFSGMETLLFSALVLVCFNSYLAFESPPISPSRNGNASEWWAGIGMGVCAALLTFTRPDGLIALALIALSFAGFRLRRGIAQRDIVWAGMAAIGCLALLVPYVVFNLRVAGFIFPSTFYAKQAEYRTVIETMSLPARFARLVLTVWAGPQVLLVPGFVFSAVASFRRRQSATILLWAWWLCIIGVYALRLPVTYQHGRYLIPAIPAFVILGVWGTWELIHSLAARRPGWILGRAWLTALVVVLLLFWVLGAQAYASDVNFINGEMGAVTEWLNQNVPAEAQLAIHDIGMVGYHLQRPFLDLAGLVTPEVIPFIDNAERLLDFMCAHGVDYVVVFPDWSAAYRQMVSDPRLTLVYSSQYKWTLSVGRQNLSVYRTDWSVPGP